MLPARCLPRTALMAPWADMDTWLEEFFGRTSGEDTTPRGIFPRADVVETEDGFDIEAELPGLAAKDVKIEVADGVITISGEKKSEKQEKTKGYHQQERSYGSFCRSFRLPASVDEKQVSASFENGVLRVSLPKQDEAKPRLVEIKEG